MAAPLFPSPDLNTIIQHIRICSKVVTPELNIIGNKRFWVCKNLFRHCRRPYAKRLGIISLAYFPASADISGSWPRAIRMDPVFAQIIARGMLTIRRMSMALCMCMPNIRCCFAPYDWPQKVSNALAIPTYLNKETIISQ